MTTIPRPTLSPKEIESLIAKGYRRISIHHGHVARIDRDDWRESMAVAMHRPKSDFNGAEDHYRRCYSKDVLHLRRQDAKKFPSSTGDQTGYVA